MIIGNQISTRVLLPKRLWEQARDQEHLKRLILEYMLRYPDYRIKSVKNGFAICIREK